MSNGKVLSYVRVSTFEQNEGRQIHAISEKYKVDKMFLEKCSAKDTKREQLCAMLDYMRDGDKIVILDFSRLARSTKDLLYLVEMMESKGVSLISLKENIDTSTSTGKLMLTMIGAINQFERDNLLERQREGIKLAVQKGDIYKGRKPIVKNEKFYSLLKEYNKRCINKSQFASILNVSRTTLNKLLAQ